MSDLLKRLVGSLAQPFEVGIFPRLRSVFASVRGLGPRGTHSGLKKQELLSARPEHQKLHSEFQLPRGEAFYIPSGAPLRGSSDFDLQHYAGFGVNRHNIDRSPRENVVENLVSLIEQPSPGTQLSSSADLHGIASAPASAHICRSHRRAPIAVVVSDRSVSPHLPVAPSIPDIPVSRDHSLLSCPSARSAPRENKTIPHSPSTSPWSLLGAAVALLAMALAGCAGASVDAWPPPGPAAFARQALFACRMGEREACWHYVTGYEPGERQ